MGVSQGMVIGILSVKNHRFHPNKRLLESAKALGHQAILINPRRFFLTAGPQGLGPRPISGDGQVDILLTRLGATIKEYGLTMVQQFESAGVRVVNGYQSILLARNKFLTAHALASKGVSIPESRYASNWFNFQKAASSLGGVPLVVKIPTSRQGTGVFLIRSLKGSREFLEALLNQGQGILVQDYIPPEKRRDFRILVAGKQVVGTMSMKPKKGDFRANIHQGSRAEAMTPSEKISALAIHGTKALGLDIAGVDMIENKDGELKVVDVNYSPGFRGLERCTGEDVGIKLMEYVINLR